MTRLFPRKSCSRFGVIAALVALTRSADTVNKSNAEIALSHDGRFVYVEDRGENELVVYRVDQNSGELSEIQRISSGGEKPWGFGVDSSGKRMLVAKQ